MGIDTGLYWERHKSAMILNFESTLTAGLLVFALPQASPQTWQRFLGPSPPPGPTPILVSTVNNLGVR